MAVLSVFERIYIFSIYIIASFIILKNKKHFVRILNSGNIWTTIDPRIQGIASLGFQYFFRYCFFALLCKNNIMIHYIYIRVRPIDFKFFFYVMVVYYSWRTNLYPHCKIAQTRNKGAKEIQFIYYFIIIFSVVVFWFYGYLGGITFKAKCSKMINKCIGDFNLRFTILIKTNIRAYFIFISFYNICNALLNLVFYNICLIIFHKTNAPSSERIAKLHYLPLIS